MTPQPAEGMPAGFMIAMRGHIDAVGSGRWSEWLIVTRWGAGGILMSVSFTGVAVCTRAAPIGLKPVSTMLARAERPAQPHAMQSFGLVWRKRDALPLAGEFLKCRGAFRLSRGAARLAGAGESAQGVVRKAWRITAVRAAWCGEFIEADPRAPV